MTENTTQTTEVQAENFICPNCGGGLRHDVKKDKFLCASCGYEGELHTGDNTVDEQSFAGYAAREAQSVPFSGMGVANCPNCGNQITFEKTMTATVCPMCGSTQISQAKQKAGIPPEGIIPFKVDKQEAEQKFCLWVKGLWFAPSKLKKSYQAGNLVGRFIPFWTYDAHGVANYTGQGGRYRTVKDKDGKEHTETDWFPTNGVVQDHFNDILVVASSGDGAQDAEAVGPFDTINSLRPYAPEYLAGYRAELYSIKADVGFDTAKEKMRESLLSMAETDIRRRFDTSRSVSVAPQYSSVTYKHVLLPVWGSIFGYAGKSYRYAVNGETGTVYGQRPYSIPKVAAAVVLALLIIIGGFQMFSGGGDSIPTNTVNQQVAVGQTAMEMPSQQAYGELILQDELQIIEI